MKAIQVKEHGGPEVLELQEVPRPEPGPGQIRLRVEAAGVNYIDVYNRTGAYPMEPPFTPGREAVGTVEAVGAGVEGIAEGDRGGFVMHPGAYAEAALVPADALVPIPEGVGADEAAALLLQGLTAHYLAVSTFPLQEGHTALVHAAAGGVGHLLVQIGSRRGARIIGTVSTEEKARQAREDGADHVILYTQENFRKGVMEFTDGGGVDVVYDSVGRSTFDDSLACLRPRGTMVLYGAASGPVPPVDPQTLNQGGSLFLTRPGLGHYVATRDELLRRAGDLFRWWSEGDLQVRIDRRFPLDQAAEAHRYMEGRKTRGKLLLIP